MRALFGLGSWDAHGSNTTPEEFARRMQRRRIFWLTLAVIAGLWFTLTLLD